MPQTFAAGAQYAGNVTGTTNRLHSCARVTFLSQHHGGFVAYVAVAPVGTAQTAKLASARPLVRTSHIASDKF